MDVGIRKLAKHVKDYFPENHRNRDIIKRELNNRIAALTTTKDFEAVDYAEEDWDNLIILDACRYDMFEDLNEMDGELKKKYSNASHTWFFLKRNFRGENNDTVYVTASPMSAGYGKHFAEIIHVWEDNWDEKNQTVQPDKVTEAAIEASKEHPDKKILVHYMQPHYPFIGEKGKDLGDQGTFAEGSRKNLTAWEKIKYGDADEEKVKQAYRENLEIALPEVERLRENLNGKTVISADHGNLIGKKVGYAPQKIYGHPPKVEDRDLRAVPWLIKGEKRKDISEKEEKNNSHENRSHDEEEVKKRLEELGYN